MFGSRSGSPYGAFGLINAPNGSAGAGSADAYSSTGIAMPSGNDLSRFSVYNKSLDYEASTVPSTFVLPSSHPTLVGGLNQILEGDFVFVLRDVGAGCGGESYETRYSRLGQRETSVVTLQKINELLRSCALQDHKGLPGGVNAVKNAWKSVDKLTSDRMWWMDPEAVASWAVPFGVALNSMKLTQNTSRDAGVGHNIVVSRRASVKNNFFTVKGDRADAWHTQSMRHVAVQYNVEGVIVEDMAESAIPVVQMSMILVDDSGRIRGTDNKSEKWFKSCDAGHGGVCRGSDRKHKSDCDPMLPSAGVKEVAGCLEFNCVHPHNPRPSELSYSLFSERPLGNPSSRVVVPIGRVLHSAPRCPTAADCLLSCHVKSVYDRMAPVEVELGCH
jgi:hypothetical protein